MTPKIHAQFDALDPGLLEDVVRAVLAQGFDETEAGRAADAQRTRTAASTASAAAVDRARKCARLATPAGARCKQASV